MTETILDLCITLVPPPPDASPEAIAMIELRCDQLGLSHTGDLLTDLFTKREREDMRWYLEEYVEWPYEQFLERGKKLEAALPEFGKRLYAIICTSPGAMGIVQAWRLQPGAQQRQVSIISEIPKALSLPWELLHDEQGFLVLRTRNPVALIRRLPQHELGAFPTSFQPPLRILLVTARPDGEEFVDPRSIARELLDEVQQQIDAGAIALEFLRPPTLPALRRRLSDSRQPSIQVVHCDGHGILSQEKQGQGMLVFEDEQGRADLVKAKDVAQVLQDSGVKLAVLTACQSAVGNTDDALSSVAAQFIRSGVDAVMAMSASVLVVTATRYTEALYRALAAGIPAPVAQERARQALHDNPRRTLHHRRADDEGTVITLRDWWLPHYYQQRPVSLQPAKPTRKRKKALEVTLPRLNADLPVAPRYGFSGRSYELLRIERALLQKKLVVIHGFGGIGKTALAREAAAWFTRTHLYDGACFLSFEQGGDASTVLSTLGRYLNIYDGNYNPGEAKAALARLQPVLQTRQILVIADNLESILPQGEIPLEPADRTLLWDVLLDLAKMGAGMVLTSRDTSFGDGRLAQGPSIRYFTLQGLRPDDAYALATHLLEDLGIERNRAPYADLRALLVQLDHHPLAIQLVLPALRSLSLSQIQHDFTALLPRFTDDTETGSNRSLVASLEYSTLRLSEAQRELLPRLAVFAGGAMEHDLLVITEISEATWAELRPALEQAALFTVEYLDGVSVPFLHFHPVLVPYLLVQARASYKALLERYAERYYEVSRYYYEQDTRSPMQVRALVQRDLPNLRRALAVQLEAGQLERAAVMAGCIGYFLVPFGLHREQIQMQQRLTQALTNQQAQAGDVLTQREYLYEINLGEGEWRKGYLQAAIARFSRLLARFEARLEGASLGSGSYEHVITLIWLGRCFHDSRDLPVAEQVGRKAIAMVETLIKRDPENRFNLLSQATLLADLGAVLLDQGRYADAKAAQEQALQRSKQLGNLREQAASQGQLGDIAFRQENYAEARLRYQEALAAFQRLGEPAMEATSWRQLGAVALEQQDWPEAERCCRKSLEIEEQLEDLVAVAGTCSELGHVAAAANRFEEAKGWHQRALALDRQTDASGDAYTRHLFNLANVLVQEVEAGRVQEVSVQLAEAQRYLEQALVIDKRLNSPGIWRKYGLLAQIANRQGHISIAQDYRRRERESYAAFAGHRFQIDQRFGSYLAAFAAAQDSQEVRAQVEESLLEGEKNGWHISEVLHRIWAGERDWHTLVEGLGSNKEALLILRVLETLAAPTDATSLSELNEPETPEETAQE